LCQAGVNQSDVALHIDWTFSQNNVWGVFVDHP